MKPLTTVLLTTALLVTQALQAVEHEAPLPAIKTLLSTPGLEIEGVPILAEEIILEAYRDNSFRPLWNREKVESLLRLINTAPNHGLDPADYEVDELLTVLSRWLQGPDASDRAEAEILLTESLLRYGYHRRYGKARANKLDPDINFRRETFNGQSVAHNVREALASPSLEVFIERIASTSPYYEILQKHLDEVRRIQAEGGWPTLPDSPTVRKGDNGPQVAALRKRLAIGGDLPAAAENGSQQFDSGLEAAVKRFQQRHGLDADGIVGRQSYAAMNVPAEDRADQLRASLERLRWVRQERQDTMVVVNIAGFNVFFMRDGEITWTTRAMVGKHYRQTPVFRGDIAYMEFNPTWTIPPGILRNDTLPAIKRNPAYLAEKNIEVIDNKGRVVDPATVEWNRYSRSVPYTLRQTPGPHNALGTVKFIFPNEHFVFLHDTPHRELFDHSQRAFSSGCIRVEDPLRLAELLLDDPRKYSRRDLQAVVDSRETQRIHLKPKVPVIIVYLTAALGPDGEAVFMKDIYQRDQAVLNALDAPVVIDLPRTHDK